MSRKKVGNLLFYQIDTNADGAELPRAAIFAIFFRTAPLAAMMAEEICRAAFAVRYPF